MKKIRFTHPDLKIIIKAEIDCDTKTINKINFGLPKKASKLEKLLLKFAEIYCYDVLRNNFHNTILQSKEYQRLVKCGN